jgi:NADH:ubiquinone oxidoreductase subunit K
VYYILAGGLLSFFFRGGSNALLIVLAQVFLVIGLFVSATQRTGLIDLLTADVLPNAAAKIEFFLLAVFLPNVIITRRSAAFILGLAILAGLWFSLQRLKVRSLELLKR